jgi:hypothetical protein
MIKINKLFLKGVHMDILDSFSIIIIIAIIFIAIQSVLMFMLPFTVGTIKLYTIRNDKAVNVLIQQNNEIIRQNNIIIELLSKK